MRESLTRGGGAVFARGDDEDLARKLRFYATSPTPTRIVPLGAARALRRRDGGGDRDLFHARRGGARAARRPDRVRALARRAAPVTPTKAPSRPHQQRGCRRAAARQANPLRESVHPPRERGRGRDALSRSCRASSARAGTTSRSSATIATIRPPPSSRCARSRTKGCASTRVNYRWSDFGEGFERLVSNPSIDRAFAEVLEREKPDVVHAHGLTCLSTTILDEAKNRGVRVGLTLHDFGWDVARGQRMTKDLDLCTDDPAAPLRPLSARDLAAIFPRRRDGARQPCQL